MQEISCWCRRLGTQVKVLPEQNEDLLPILSASNWEFYATMIHQCAEKPWSTATRSDPCYYDEISDGKQTQSWRDLHRCWRAGAADGCPRTVPCRGDDSSQICSNQQLRQHCIRASTATATDRLIATVQIHIMLVAVKATTAHFHSITSRHQPTNKH